MTFTTSAIAPTVVTLGRNWRKYLDGDLERNRQC